MNIRFWLGTFLGLSLMGLAHAQEATDWQSTNSPPMASVDRINAIVVMPATQTQEA